MVVVVVVAVVVVVEHIFSNTALDEVATEDTARADADVTAAASQQPECVMSQQPPASAVDSIASTDTSPADQPTTLTSDVVAASLPTSASGSSSTADSVSYTTVHVASFQHEDDTVKLICS